ncbi:hypothetical protein AXG93_4776s1030 [Marchantia polymorpha subsp. ruderalis]|uniref:Uncharacterized protein n=1 Tax=Marchantia polymorpha subsp. ruderalis TaxID=1480154 RepID=A0A176VTJ6_MARPO|nr:hypothetical protein AXG93_4776s1030 [Marchantia polymorpha subsp. ruderalis]
MRPVPPSDLSGRTETSTSRVVDTDTPSSAVTRMASSVMRFPLFLGTELMDSGIDLARVFCAAAPLCERGSITATSAEIGETICEKLSSTTPSSDESTWQAAAARMESLPARPANDRERVILGVCMMDNWSGVFCLVSRGYSIYEEVEEMMSVAAEVSSSLDVPLWGSCHALQHEADSETAASLVLEASRRQVLDHAMNLNCLTWIMSLGLAEQRRLRVDLVVVTTLVSSLPTGTVVAMFCLQYEGVGYFDWTRHTDRVG